MTRAIVNIGPVRANQAFEVRTLLQHPMENGQRSDENGKRIPRRIVTEVEVRFEGELAWSAMLGPGIAANPYLAFWLSLPSEGELLIDWRGDEGFSHRERVAIRFAP